MKAATLFAPFFAFVFVALSVHAQGTFQNLDFESANPVIVSGNTVTAASAFPDWTVTVGGGQQSQVTYNAASTGATWVSLVGPGYGAIDGNYSALLQGGVTESDASISQTGLIPANAESLLFEEQGLQASVNPQIGAGNFSVLIGNQSISFGTISSGPNYTLYGANISAWAGESEQLTFSALEGQLNNFVIDDISFSPNTVPEPSPLVLTGVGGLLFALYRRFAPKR